MLGEDVLSSGAEEQEYHLRALRLASCDTLLVSMEPKVLDMGVVGL